MFFHAFRRKITYKTSFIIPSKFEYSEFPIKYDFFHIGAFRKACSAISGETLQNIWSCKRLRFLSEKFLMMAFKKGLIVSEGGESEYIGEDHQKLLQSFSIISLVVSLF